MDVDAYLARIGVARPAKLDAEALRTLQEAHLLRVPFENLSVHLPEPIDLDPAALVGKIVRRGRGGFCFELNGAFALLLRELGFEVTLHAVRVFGDEGRLGPPYDHLALRVELDEPWLADVGFGRFCRYPLRLDFRGVQADPEGEFEVREAPFGELDVLHNGRPANRIEPRPRELAEFVPMAWWHSTSPKSHFTKSLTCSRPTPAGRVTLSGDKLIETVDGVREERTLTGDAEILDAYRTSFGIELDQVPRVRTFS
ncbi:arylamine N-acetyltransferase [Amycolatopsis sp. NPDC059657]|uniref:arylamine N-acetyltransferase family protein n=1 Tax=Amycolatopsis sp. NPDC059657 TaxID=3346899 RepID=UPI00366D5035